MLDFSVFLAGIRPQNWLALYESIKVSTQREFELIFVGPHGLPDEMKDLPNVKFIEDWGCPSRCYQIGLLASTAPYVTFVADDGVFLDSGAIDTAFRVLDSPPVRAVTPHKKNVISFRYYEGPITEDSFIAKSAHWKMGTHKFFRKLGVPPQFNLVMTALVDREYLIELGGFDCAFDHLGLGAPDLAVRMQKDGANVLMGEHLIHVTWWPGHMGDHGPIHDSHNEHEIPLFKSIYSDPNVVNRIRIDVNNWQSYPEVWPRRFGDEIKGIHHPELLR